jgi:hypothetical protein
MKSRRSTVARAALLALVSFLAATLVPRDAFYVHRHAADGHGHVHGWDGTRVGASTTSMRDLVADHDHEQAHQHGLAHEHEHAPASAATSHDRGPASEHGRDGPSFGGALGTAHGHWQAPFQAVARASTPALLGLALLLAACAALATTAPQPAPHALRARGPPLLSV